MLKLLLLTSVTWSAVSFFLVGAFGLLLHRRGQSAFRASRSMWGGGVDTLCSEQW